jgi:two-component system phosphate regulon sensor histidine kinase PhoR
MSLPFAVQRTTEQIRFEIEECLGFLPPFFEPALDTPAVLDSLWQQTRSAYVDSPLPALFKERLIAYTSRYCAVPYCMVFQACGLAALGMNAREVLELLRSGSPILGRPEQAVSLLAGTEPGMPWPEADSVEEDAVFACAALAFVGGEHAGAANAALSAALRPADRNHLSHLLGFVKACHAWVEANPQIDFRADPRAAASVGRLIAAEPELGHFFGTYGAEVASERDAAERALALALMESRERFAQVFDRAPVGMALHTLEGRFVAVNQELCRLSGYDAEFLRGKTLADVTPPEDHDTDIELLGEMVAGESNSYTIEKRSRFANGRIVWTEVSASLIRDQSGDPQYVVAYVKDVDERHRAQDDLRASESRFRSAFDNALVGMAIMGVDGRARQVNATLSEMLGRSKHELAGMHFGDVTHPDDVPADRENLRSILSGERDGGRWDKRYVHSSGRTVWVELSVSLVRDDDGEPHHYVAQVNDIGDRKRADQLKDEFIATVSHELRSPLTSIQGYVELLAEDEERSELDRRWLGIVDRNAHRLRRLVDDLLFMAQAKAQTLTVQRTDVDLAELVRKAVEGAAPGATEHGVELAVSVDGAIVVPNTDADRIGQAVDNLISNALKYTEPGGGVDVRVEARGDRAAISVADTGIGMSPDDVERLFERFFRASTAIDSAIPGVGLGLSIVKVIVDLHGGEVTVDSRKGVGTTFEILLPASA